jgi:hypothetical protein
VPDLHLDQAELTDHALLQAQRRGLRHRWLTPSFVIPSRSCEVDPAESWLRRGMR